MSQLIEIIERDIAEREKDLEAARQYLTVLRRASATFGTSQQRHVTSLRNGPIVYPQPKAAKQKQPKGKLTIEARGVIRGALAKHPEGLTVSELRQMVHKVGLKTSDHTVHNALRGLGVTSTKDPQLKRGAKVYRLAVAQAADA